MPSPIVGSRRPPAVVVALAALGVALLATGVWRTLGPGDRGRAGASEASASTEAASGSVADRPSAPPTTVAAPTTAVADITGVAVGSLGYDRIALTPDGRDTFDVLADGPGFTAAAPPANRGAGLRIGVVPRGVPVSADERVCVTWHGPAEYIAQGGLVLRVRSGDQGTRAILVTNNVFMSYRTAFNVHLLDSTAGHALDQVGSIILPDSVGDDPTTQVPPPWRLCAQVIGSTVTIKAWPTALRAGEPAWDDPTTTGTVELPPGWTEPGRSGVFVGHLTPGQAVRFSDLVVGPATP